MSYATVGGTAPVWIPDDRHAGLISALFGVLLVFMVVPEGFNYANLSPDAIPSSGSALSRLIWLGLLGGAGLVLLLRVQLGVLLLRSANPLLLAVFALACGSVLWSIEPAVTVRRLVRLSTILLVCLGFTLIGWHRQRFSHTTRITLTALLTGSLLFGLVAPHYAIHASTASELVGAWRGLTNHKNSLGALAAIGLVFWFHALLSRQVRVGAAAVGGGIALCCLLLSRSSSSLMSGLFPCAMLLLMLRTPPNLRPYIRYFVGGFVVLLLIYSLAVLRIVPQLEFVLKPIVMFSGKDLSFTGRSDIWEIILEHVRFHPLLGTGYGAYWTGPTPDSPSYEHVLKLYFYPASAHSGYLEVLNDLGAAGLLCLIGFLLLHIAQTLKLMRFDRTQASLHLGLFFQQALCNLSESHWFQVTSFSIGIVTLSSLSVSRQLLDLKLRQRFGIPAPDDTP